MTTRQATFFSGVKASSPLILGMVPFALIAGIAAVNAGLSTLEALAMSYIVFAGAAQLATVDLVGQQAPVIVIVFTALIINLRFFMYSAAIAPHFQGLPLHARGGLAYLLTDQAFAVSMTAYNRGRHEYKAWFYLGAAMTMWLTWQIGTSIGVFVGARVPESWSLEFAIPLTFLALLLPSVKDRPCVVAAISAGILALVGAGLPYNLGLFLAALGGIGAGVLADTRKSHDR